MKKIGKKGKEWLRERKKIIKDALADGTLIRNEEGNLKARCEDCLHYHNITPEHELNRSQGGKHNKSNIGWICNEPPCWCHSKRHDMVNSKKVRKGKSNWQIEHECIACKKATRQLICDKCGFLSIKA